MSVSTALIPAWWTWGFLCWGNRLTAGFADVLRQWPSLREIIEKPVLQKVLNYAYVHGYKDKLKHNWALNIHCRLVSLPHNIFDDAKRKTFWSHLRLSLPALDFLIDGGYDGEFKMALGCLKNARIKETLRKTGFQAADCPLNWFFQMELTKLNA